MEGSGREPVCPECRDLFACQCDKPKYTAKRGPSTEDLKSDLNDLLISVLPGSTEVAKLDEIAMDVIEAVDAEWDRHEKEHGT